MRYRTLLLVAVGGLVVSELARRTLLKGTNLLAYAFELAATATYVGTREQKQEQQIRAEVAYELGLQRI